MKTAIISCSLGGFDNSHPWEEQTAEVFRFNESNWNTRTTIGPSVQCKVPKFFGWDMAKGFDTYIWTDGCYQFLKGASDYMVEQLGDNDIVVFPHPYGRTSIREEWQWIKDNMHKSYIKSRYARELGDEQYRVIEEDKEYVDDLLLHTAILAYKNNEKTRAMLKEVWYNVSRFHTNDQLCFSYVMRKSGCKYKVMDKIITDVPFWKYHRHLKGN